jgi:hypothetical protein
MKRITFLLLCTYLPVLVWSQISFEKSYSGFPGVTSSLGTCVVQTSDQGYAISATMHKETQNSFLMIKTNPAGDTTRTVPIEGGVSSFISAMDGGFVATGGKDHKLMMLKMDADFNTVWSYTTGTDFSIGSSVCQTSDSGFCFIGDVGIYMMPTNQIYVVRTDKHGNILWTKSIGGNLIPLRGYAVISSPDGGFIICGNLQHAGIMSAFLLKLNSLGDSLWTKTYNRSDNSQGYTVLPSENNGYMLFGTDDPTGETFSLYLVNTNDQGDTVWTKTYNCLRSATKLTAAKMRNGGYIAAGTRNGITDITDICLIRITDQGDTLWTKSVGTLGNEVTMSLKQTLDDGFVVCGYVSNLPDQESAVYLVKTDSLGQYYPAGFGELADNHRIRLFPNPFKTVINVTSDDPVRSAELFNIHGQLVYAVTFQSKDTQHITISPGIQPDGIYFLRIATDKTIKTRKLFKIN